jgi:DNA gyrase subunit B
VTAATTETSYGADDMLVLEGLDAVRKRPGMYIGSTDSRGVNHLVSEIVDNSVDEAVAGHCTRIEVTLHADGSVEVTDNGRGIPTDINTKTGISGVELALTRLHGGGKFSAKNYNSSGGLHGVGSTAVNALSQRMDATVRRSAKVHQVSFKYGETGEFAGPGPAAAFTAKTGLRVTGKCPKNQTGTSIRYWVHLGFFDEGSALQVDSLTTKLRNTAFLVPGLEVHFRNEWAEEVIEQTFHFADGLRDMVDFLTPVADRPVCDTVLITGTGSYREKARTEDGRAEILADRTIEVEIALRWGTGYETTVECFTNTIRNVHGGTHRKGFESGIYRALTEAIKGTRGLLRAKEESPTRDDMLEGLTAVIHVRVPEPKFTSQTKDEMSTAGVTRAVQTVVEEHLKTWVEARKTKPEARVVLGKIVDASRVRLTQKAQKDAARRKTAMEGASMPGKLTDCTEIGPRSELFLVEGDSANGSAKKARTAKYQALLALRGKPLNVWNLPLDKAMKNEEIDAIIRVIGAGTGSTFDLDRMRYGRIILMADADVDGSHIRALLIALFYKFMRPVIESGRLYAAVPPLHTITLKGRDAEPIYTYTQQAMSDTLARLEAEGKKIDEVNRNKGLGEMDAPELWATTMNPAVRKIRRITMADAEASHALLDVLMGDKVAPRYEWIIENSTLVPREAIDA